MNEIDVGHVPSPGPLNPDARGRLIDDLSALARSMADHGDEEIVPVVLSERPDGVAVRVGGIVAKAHAADTDVNVLALRLRTVAHPLLGNMFLPPLCARPRRLPHWLVSLWPAGEPVRLDEPDDAPWEPAARLLARLHATPVNAVFGADPPPTAGGPDRLARAIARLRTARDSSAKRAVLAAFATLPPPAHMGVGNALVHGDWHFGQLVRWPAAPVDDTSRWRLIDVDDLGIGDPAWDLARPAAWYAADLLPRAPWLRFLDSYRAAGGRAVPARGDPWPRLELPARALAVQSAARAVAAAQREDRAPDEVEQALIETCRRIVRTAVRCEA